MDKKINVLGIFSGIFLIIAWASNILIEILSFELYQFNSSQQLITIGFVTIGLGIILRDTMVDMKYIGSAVSIIGSVVIIWEHCSEYASTCEYFIEAIREGWLEPVNALSFAYGTVVALAYIFLLVHFTIELVANIRKKNGVKGIAIIPAIMFSIGIIISIADAIVIAAKFNDYFETTTTDYIFSWYTFGELLLVVAMYFIGFGSIAGYKNNIQKSSYAQQPYSNNVNNGYTQQPYGNNMNNGYMQQPVNSGYGQVLNNNYQQQPVVNQVNSDLTSAYVLDNSNSGTHAIEEQQSSVQKSVKYCSQCGSQVDINSKFCTECGNKFQ